MQEPWRDRSADNKVSLTVQQTLEAFQTINFRDDTSLRGNHLQEGRHAHQYAHVSVKHADSLYSWLSAICDHDALTITTIDQNADCTAEKVTTAT